MSKILESIKDIFPKSKVLLAFYCGSKAYDLFDEFSDEDVTVVLDNFNGNLHLNLGDLDFFVFSKDRFIEKQTFDLTVTPYHRASADVLLSLDKTLIHIDHEFKHTVNSLLNINHKEFFLNLLDAQIEYGEMRWEQSQDFKSHYHLFRFRGLLEHFEKTGKFELVIEEPWKTYTMTYKKHWDDEIGQKYHKLLEEQLQYLKDYRDRMKSIAMG